MNKKQEIPQERIARIKTLIYYVCAHRVKTYYGTRDNLLKSMAKLKRWRRYSREQKNAYQKSWADIAREHNKFNACFSIPRGLIADILGYYRDDNGKKRRYSPTQMVKQLGGFLSCVYRHGNKLEKKDGDYTVSGSWAKKYILNEKLFYKLWSDDSMKRYFGFKTLGDKRLQDLIEKYFKRVDKPEEKTTPETHKENKMEEYPTYAANVPDEDVIQETIQPKPKVEQPRQQPVKLLPRLQEFVDRRVISSGEARNFSKVYGVDTTIKTPRNEFQLQDVADMTREQLIMRGKVLEAFIKETQNLDLDDAARKTVKATYGKLDEIVKKLTA